MFIKMERSLFAFLAVLLLVSLIAIPAHAAEMEDSAFFDTDLGYEMIDFRTGTLAVTPDGTGDDGSSKLSLLNRTTHMNYITGRTAAQAAPNAAVTRAEAAVILYRLLTPAAKEACGISGNRFRDVSEKDWYGTAVSTLANLGVISGYQDGTFRPQYSITRAELAAILSRFCETASDSAKDYFSDISGSWARKYINQAAESGLVCGYADGTFRPDQNITRAETIVMVNRILGRSVSADTVVKGYKTFPDVPDGAWYYWDIVEASNLHTIQMDGSVEKWDALG